MREKTKELSTTLYEDEKIVKKVAEEVVEFLKIAEVLPENYETPRVSLKNRITDDRYLNSLLYLIGGSCVGLLSILSGNLLGLTILPISVYQAVRTMSRIVGGINYSTPHGREILVSDEGIKKIAKYYFTGSLKKMSEKDKLRVSSWIIISHEMSHQQEIYDEKKASAYERIIVYVASKNNLLPIKEEDIINLTKSDLKYYKESVLYRIFSKFGKFGLRLLSLIDDYTDYIVGRAYALLQLENQPNIELRELRQLIEELREKPPGEIYQEAGEYLKKL
jgi:hypothetical protein